MNTPPTKEAILQAIRDAASALGRTPSRSDFVRHSGIGEHQINNHFDTWNDAVGAAGLEPHTKNLRLDESVLLEDWAKVVRKLGEIPTFVRYRREGAFSPDVFQRRFGAWSRMPDAFRDFAKGNPTWDDVVALLPTAAREQEVPRAGDSETIETPLAQPFKYAKLDARPTYGNPIDFRGLRHEPVNEQGVVFLFGMVAKEIGFMVEAVQTGFPDCEAKRQISPRKWQRVRIEFEFESRNFRDHGHACDGCDVIVCWRHNWPEAPQQLEVVELSSVINRLSRGDD